MITNRPNPSPTKPYERRTTTGMRSSAGLERRLSQSVPMNSLSSSNYASSFTPNNTGTPWGPPTSYSGSNSTSAPRTPPRNFASSMNGPSSYDDNPYSRSGYGSSYGSGYGSGYGSSYGSGYGSGYGSSYGGYGMNRYGSAYGSGYGSYNGSYNTVMNPFSRDPKYFITPEDGPVGNSFGWINDVQNFVQTFAKISMLLDINFETLASTFTSIVRFVDRLNSMKTQVTPILQALTLLTCLGVAGSKAARWLNPRKKEEDSDVYGFKQMEGAASRKGLFGRLSPLVLLCTALALVVGLPMLWRLCIKLWRKQQGLPLEQSTQKNEVKARALFDYPGESNEDLPFRRGDILTVLSSPGPGWIEAKHADGRIGLVPENFIEPIENQSAEESQSASEQASNTSQSDQLPLQRSLLSQSTPLALPAPDDDSQLRQPYSRSRNTSSQLRHTQGR